MPIKPPKPLVAGGRIPTTREINDADPLYLSFKLLDIFTNEKFHLKHCEQPYLEKFVLRLQELNRLRIKDFRTYKPEWRNHEIQFAETSEPEGFKQLPEQLRAKEAWQFQLTRAEYGRIHGILMDDIFYIVWIDPCHKLYPADSICNH
jgi:hypothetical protein